MIKEEVEEWCKINHHIIIDLTVKKIPEQDVLKIAEGILEIDNISKRTREEEYVFARAIATNYLLDYIPKKKIAKLLKVDKASLYNYKNVNFFRDDRYLLGWQKFAIDKFKDKIKEIEEKLNGKKEN
jgi:hypothetical protein